MPRVSRDIPHYTRRHDITFGAPSFHDRRRSPRTSSNQPELHPFVTDHSTPICPVTEIRKRLESDANSRARSLLISFLLCFLIYDSPSLTPVLIALCPALRIVITNDVPTDYTWFISTVFLHIVYEIICTISFYYLTLCGKWVLRYIYEAINIIKVTRLYDTTSKYNIERLPGNIQFIQYANLITFRNFWYI